MKLIIFFLKAEIVMLSVAAVLFVGCGKATSTDGSAANATQAEALRKEIASLKTKLANAQSRLDSLRDQLNGVDAPSVADGLSAPEIIEELMEIKVSSENRRSIQRRIDYLLESLYGQGEAAVPHIREFLNKMEDIDFAVQRSRSRTIRFSMSGAAFGGGLLLTSDKGVLLTSDKGVYRLELGDLKTELDNRHRATLNFEQPPSLRIGLIDILGEIGGNHAETALAEVLSTTGRGFEVAYTAKIIQRSIGKDAYRKEAIAAAHELLLDPIDVVGGNRFDRVSKQYLFMVLEMYNDQSFIQSAQGMFINEDGRIDRTILGYFEDVGKVRALDAMVQAFRSGQVVEDDMDNLAEAASRYVGINPQADQLFRDIMTSNKYNMETKRDAIRSFTESDGDASTPGVAPHVLQARLNLINTLQYDESDLMGKGMQLLSMRLESQITGKKMDERKAREAASRLFGELEKQESREGKSGQKKPSAQPTIVPAD
jgi:hypothetical protein